MSEDCLNLNVWTTGTDDTPRPVLVWVHGGRFLFGASAEPSYDGTNLAATGVVVVSVSYRLGAFGFLATEDLSAESGEGSGDYGLLDVLAALRWVRDNIAAFGGDTHRITVAGQSCGGAISTILIYSPPLATGLFDQVLIESACLHPRDPMISTLAPSHRLLTEAEADGATYLANHGVTTAAELRSATVEDVLAGSDVDDPRVPGHPRATSR